MRLLISILLCVLVYPTVVKGEPEMHTGRSYSLWCTLEELLPGLEGNFSARWSSQQLDTPPFDCSCPMLRASFICPNLEAGGYPVWQPAAVADGSCRIMGREVLLGQPLPPDSTILVYGDSLLQQMVEAIACMSRGALKSRRVTLSDARKNEERAATVDVGAQCRDCLASVGAAKPSLVGALCLAADEAQEACRCHDHQGVFEFKNGAEIHFYLPSAEGEKRIEAALEAHGTSYGDYDMIFANPAGSPPLQPKAFLESSRDIWLAGVPFMWMPAYGGEGDPRTYLNSDEMWSMDYREVKFMPLQDMLGAVEWPANEGLTGGDDGHFCMPGPPGEIGLLWLQLVWSDYVRKLAEHC